MLGLTNVLLLVEDIGSRIAIILKRFSHANVHGQPLIGKTWYTSFGFESVELGFLPFNDVPFKSIGRPV